MQITRPARILVTNSLKTYSILKRSQEIMFQAIVENIFLRIIKRGEVPRHVAFVADGARRFGKKYNIPVQENHEIG